MVEWHHLRLVVWFREMLVILEGFVLRDRRRLVPRLTTPNFDNQELFVFAMPDSVNMSDFSDELHHEQTDLVVRIPHQDIDLISAYRFENGRFKSASISCEKWHHTFQSGEVKLVQWVVLHHLI
uniref:(northern house mosquito) hypothetical protein n=1 Tax=Culex pipiens TaxID=7175 RepID=A0A8D8DLL6_CULPI